MDKQTYDDCRICGLPLGCVVYRVANQYDICQSCFDDVEELVDQLHAIAANIAENQKAVNFFSPESQPIGEEFHERWENGEL